MSLREVLDAHPAADALEAEHLDVIRRFAAAHADPFDRRILEAHCTASAFVVAADGNAVLLVHHRRLDCWLQPGGHGEPGERDAATIALREAVEETGIPGLALHPTAPRPLDVDVHRIPEAGGIAAHDHLDVRYLVVAPEGAQPQACAQETRGARWFTWLELETLPLDRPMRRALKKARQLTARE